MPKGEENEYFGGGMVINDARNRNVNTMGDGFAPKPQPKPMMPLQPPNQTGNYDLYDQYVDKYNEDIQLGKDGGKVEKYKAGGKIVKKGAKKAAKALYRPEKIEKYKKANIKAKMREGKEKYKVPKKYDVTDIVKEISKKKKKK